MSFWLFSLFSEPLDERFIVHRYKATRLAMMVGIILMFGLFTCYIVASRVIRWDLFVVICVMAVTKVIAMTYYRRTN